MVRHSAALVLAGFLQAACQMPPAKPMGALTPADPAPEESGDAAANVLPEAFAGTWFVSAVYPAGEAPASQGDQHLGVRIAIEAAETSDINGQRCAAPQLAADRAGQQLRLGDVVARDLARLTITCADKGFATYLLLPGRSLDASDQAQTAEVPPMLVAERPEAHYLLERAEQVLFRQASVPVVQPGERRNVTASAAATIPVELAPAMPALPAPPAEPAASKSADPTLNAPLILAPAMPEPAPEPAPAAKPAATVAETDGGPPAAGTAIHLASYSGISAAKRGWKTLLGEFDALDPLSPVYVEIDVPEKGRMIRLYATGGDAAGLKGACDALVAKGAYCQMAR